MPRQWLAWILWCCAAWGSFVATAKAGTFEVTTTNDSGPGSLRQAILDADLSAGPHSINITATGALQLTSPLPVINKSFSNELSIKGPGAGSLTVDGAGTTANPGCYSSISVGSNKKLTLNPGTYIITGANATTS